ncbi:MAG: hypothetical protein ACRETD_03600, partial [Steroidobacteraceae bacterium]
MPERPSASAKSGESVVMEKEELPVASEAPLGFLRRHRVAFIVLVIMVAVIALLLRFVNYKQRQTLQLQQQQAAAMG